MPNRAPDQPDEQPGEQHQPRRPRRFAAGRAAGAALRAITALGLVALVAAPEQTIVWTWPEPQWMLQSVQGSSSGVFGMLSAVDGEILTLPSFVFPTDIGAQRRFGVGIQSAHAVQRNADIDPDQFARAWKRLRGGAAPTQAADWPDFRRLYFFR